MSDLKGDATKRRLFAMMFDTPLPTILCIVVAAKFPGNVPSAVRYVILVVTFLLYFFLPEAIWGATLGKRIFGLRVVHIDGTRAGWMASFWRTILRLIEVNPVLLGAIPGGLAVTWSKRGQRLGDMLARTVVVRQDDLMAWSRARA